MPTPCPHCGAPAGYAACEARWHALLALDHSHKAPWGPHHGLAFAAWTLQHSELADARSVSRALAALTRITDGGEDQAAVFASYRESGGHAVVDAPVHRSPPHVFAVTIHDLGEFAAESYVGDLRRWAEATLRAWSPR